jgi:hypothetical protein
MAVELLVPFRVVVDRVHYEDLARHPYTPPNPDLHHRDETLSGIADPQLALHLGHQGATWSTGGKIGISIPIGRTEPNPFELGRQGLWHQHIQFGTGTWDPVLGFGVARSFGELSVEASAAARLAFTDNEHGYRAGDRYAVRLLGAHKLGGSWGADGGFLYAHESAETWDGRVETEGNLGRSDLFVSLGVSRATAKRGALFLDVQIPVWSESTGEQVDSSLVVTFGWNF